MPRGLRDCNDPPAESRGLPGQRDSTALQIPGDVTAEQELLGGPPAGRAGESAEPRLLPPADRVEVGVLLGAQEPSLPEDPSPNPTCEAAPAQVCHGCACRQKTARSRTQDEAAHLPGYEVIEG